jgi:hypothetical protein
VEQEIMNVDELKKILADHALWLSGDSAGIRANLRRADLTEADLRGADLRGADLTGADLIGADLTGADLIGADLRGADLTGAIGYILGPQRSDGYQFSAVYMDDVSGWKVIAGCRCMPIEDYREHIKSYNDPAKAAETTAILDFIEARIKQVGDPK